MKGSFSIGKIAGIGIFIHWTFLILIGLMLLPQGKSLDVFWNLAFVLTLFSCVVLHELGHALAARHFGIATRDITLLPIGGVARLDRIPEEPRQELVVAIAGPAVNVVIAAILYPFVWQMLTSGWFNAIQVIGANNFFSTLFTVNLSLAAFNLLPAFPMDGGRVFRALLGFRMSRVKATRLAAGVGQFIAVLFAMLGLLTNPFLIFIGLFVFFGARQEWQAMESGSWLAGHRTGDVTITQYGSLSPGDPVSKAVQALLTSPSHNFLVFENEKIVGTLGRRSIIRALADRGAEVAVGEVMNQTFPEINIDAPVEQALVLIQKDPDQFAVVTRQGQVAGLVDLEHIAELMMVQRAALQAH